MKLKLLSFTLLLSLSFLVHAEPLQTQYLDNGAELNILKARVAKNNVLTIVAQYDNTSGADFKASYHFKHVYYIDPEENKKYHVLKDENEKYIASPASSGFLQTAWMKPGAKSIIWFKFPAPASETSTINLMLRGATPFDDLPITR